ncbi:MAG: DUF4339 domain-containing protein [Parachlamydiales bacterium]|jgi:hypothetical protein
MQEIAKNKIWYLWVNGKEEGPFSLAEVQSHPALTPDLYVRKEGSDKWTPARHVPELQRLFEDPQEIAPEIKKTPLLNPAGDELTLSYQDPSSFWFWLLVLGIVLTYLAIYSRGS